jgi:hypothetical protein
MINDIPLEVLICYCAKKIIQENYLDEDVLIQIYRQLQEMYGDMDVEETIH